MTIVPYYRKLTMCFKITRDPASAVLTIVGVNGNSMLFMKCMVRFSDVCIREYLQQKHIQNAVKHLRWCVLTIFAKKLFLKLFDRVLNTPLHIK